MSAKPGTLPRWADVGGSIVVPPAGTLNVGHLSNQAPLHSYENWYKNLVYLWIVYLNDGDVTMNNVLANGTLTVKGNTTLGDNAAVDTVTVNADVTLSAGSDLAVGGNASVTGALTVAGNTTLGDNSAVDTVTVNADLTLSAGSDLLVLGNSIVSALAAGSLVITVNQNITLSGTGKIKHGSRSISYAPTPSQVITISGTAAVSPGSGLPGASLTASSQYRIPVPIPDTTCTIRTVLISDRLSGASFTTFIEKYNNSSGVLYTTVTTTGGSGTGVVTSTITGGVQLIQQETLWIELLAPAGGLHITNVCCTYDSV